jgi:hypothetical protein
MKYRIEATCPNPHCQLNGFTTLRNSMTYRANREGFERIINRVPCPNCGRLADVMMVTSPAEQAVA